MTTLITGGTGFLGSEVARVLLSEGETGITLFDLDPSAARLGGLSSEVVRHSRRPWECVRRRRGRRE